MEPVFRHSALLSRGGERFLKRSIEIRGRSRTMGGGPKGGGGGGVTHTRPSEWRPCEVEPGVGQVNRTYTSSCGGTGKPGKREGGN